MSARDIYRRKISGLKSASEVKAALKTLEDAGIVRPQERTTGGRTQHLFVTNPHLWGD